MPKERRKYSLELKQQAVQYYLAGKGSLRNVCKKYGIKDKKQLRYYPFESSKGGVTRKYKTDRYEIFHKKEV